MQLIGAVLPGARRFRRVPLRLSPDAKRRLAWLDWYRAHGQNARATCRHFGISPATFYRWQGRFNPGDLRTLDAESHRSVRVRQPETSKLNGGVERSTRTHREEFYEVEEVALTVTRCLMNVSLGKGVAEPAMWRALVFGSALRNLNNWC